MSAPQGAKEPGMEDFQARALQEKVAGNAAHKVESPVRHRSCPYWLEEGQLTLVEDTPYPQHFSDMLRQQNISRKMQQEYVLYSSSYPMLIPYC